MRDTRFRVWDVYEKKMVTDKGVNELMSIDDDGSVNAAGGFHTNIVMQSIGRKDDNGKAIYEGDIVRIVDTCEEDLMHIGVVKFADCSFMVRAEFSGHYRWMDYDCEILGNIYENPELITW